MDYLLIKKNNHHLQLIENDNSLFQRISLKTKKEFLDTILTKHSDMILNLNKQNQEILLEIEKEKIKKEYDLADKLLKYNSSLHRQTSIIGYLILIFGLLFTIFIGYIVYFYQDSLHINLENIILDTKKDLKLDILPITIWGYEIFGISYIINFIRKLCIIFIQTIFVIINIIIELGLWGLLPIISLFGIITTLFIWKTFMIQHITLPLLSINFRHDQIK